MPVLTTTAYPSVEEVLNLWRVFVNDSYNGGAGRTAVDTASFTIPLLNSALRMLQRKLENNGVGTFTVDNYILQNVTPVPNPDPGSPCYISYTGYFDGTNQNQNPYLPSNLLVPLEMWERPSGTTLDFQYMQQQSPMPSQLQTTYNGIWAYYSDAINFPGATQQIDFRLRYKAAILAPINVAPANFATTYIQCLDCQEAIAYMMAKWYSAPRGGITAEQEKDGQEAVRQMINRQVRAQQSEDFSRESFGQSDASFTGGNAGNW
jgi:hypothetical protein